MQNIKHFKNEIHWDKFPCGSDFIGNIPETLEDYLTIEKRRYQTMPFLKPFANFEKYRDKKVLEAGCGIGTDLVQWIKAGANLSSIDQSKHSLELARRNLMLRGLDSSFLQEASVEELPFADNSFDLVYSWGVVPHTNDVLKSISELFRVAKPGGEVKFIVYNRYSFQGLFLWLSTGLPRGKFSIDYCFRNFMQNLGTCAFTVNEITEIVKKEKKLQGVTVKPVLTTADRLEHRRNATLSSALNLVESLPGLSRFGFYLLIHCKLSD